MACWALLLAALAALAGGGARLTAASSLSSSSLSPLSSSSLPSWSLSPVVTGRMLPPSAPRVVGFWLVNATSGVWARRRLRDGDTVPAADLGVAVNIAALSSAGRRYTVVFTAPAAVAHTELKAPYLAGVDEGEVLPSLRLPPGPVSLSAYVNYSTEWTPATTTVRLVVAPRPTPGPFRCASPWPPPRRADASPLPTAAPPRGDDTRRLPVPPASCAGREAPTRVMGGGGTNRGGPNPWYFYVFGALCNGTTARVSVYVTADDGVSAVRRVEDYLFVSRTDSLQSLAPDGRGRYFGNVWSGGRQCGSPAVFATVCVQPRVGGGGGARAGDGGGGVCVRSPDQRMPPAEPPRLVLVARPPWVLAVAPGDAATILATVDVPAGLTLVGVARSRCGGECRTPAVSGGRLAVDVAALTGGMPAAANGTVVAIEYAAPDCPTTVTSSEVVAATTLTVAADVDPLVKQDVRPPSAVVGSYPSTPEGKPVTVSVAFVNAGGGRRRDRLTGSLRATELHYQWLVDTERPVGRPPSPPTALAGETGPTLRLAAARQAIVECNRGGCGGLYGYLVDVCNTAGCTRSPLVVPVVV